MKRRSSESLFGSAAKCVSQNWWYTFGASEMGTIATFSKPNASQESHTSAMVSGFAATFEHSDGSFGYEKSPVRSNLSISFFVSSPTGPFSV